jgi:hypothetical protein
MNKFLTNNDVSYQSILVRLMFDSIFVHVDWQHSTHIYNSLNKDFENIRQRLDVKRIDEYYSMSSVDSQLSMEQQRQWNSSMENLGQLSARTSSNYFTDFNPLSLKQSVDGTCSTFKIDCVSLNEKEKSRITMI